MFVNFDCQYDRGVAWKPDGWELKPFRQQVTTLAELRQVIDEVRMCGYYGLAGGDMNDAVWEGVDIVTSFWSLAAQLAAQVPGAAAAMPVMPAAKRPFEDGLRYHCLFNKADLNQCLCELSVWAISWLPGGPTGPTAAGAAAGPGALIIPVGTVALNMPPPVSDPRPAPAAATTPASPPTVGLADQNSSQPATAAAAGLPAPVSGPEPSASAPAEKGVMKQGPTTWYIRLGDESASVTHNVNIRRVALLLSRPEQPVTNADLTGNGGNKHTKPPDSLDPLVDAENTDDRPRSRRHLRQEPVDPIMDTECLHALRRRLAEAKLEHERLIKNNDPIQAEKAQREIEFIQSELSKAVNVHGNQRTFQPSDAAKNRKNVAMSLTRAYATFEEHGLHGLVAHLKASIHRRKGELVYEPAADDPDWDIAFL